jgi:uncharacterized membrane protein
MQTKILMTTSALLMGIAGILLLFVPEELLSSLGIFSTSVSDNFAHFLGALYLAFAATNWMARANLIRGTYGRPIVVGNFVHFFLGSLLFLRELRFDPLPFWELAIMCVYVLFAVFFGRILFTNPVNNQQTI